MELSEALSALKHLNEEKFCQAFQKMNGKFFHVDNLIYWCELTGTSQKNIWRILRRQGWQQLCNGIYVRGTIDTMEGLEGLSKLYGLDKQTIIDVVVKVVDKCQGDVSRVLQELPLSHDVTSSLLDLQDCLIPVTRICWLPKSVLPDPLRQISRYAHFNRNKWDQMIIATFFRIGRPLRLEQLIYQSMGLVQPQVSLKRKFSFLLELLPVSKIDHTEYWILTEWVSRVDLKLVDIISELLNENGNLSLCEIENKIKEYQVGEISEILSFWPEFAQNSDGAYIINITPLNDELLALLIPSLLKYLAEAVDGIPISQLFKYAGTIVNSHGLQIHSRDFKSFLKGWGEVAIVDASVYLLHHAPFGHMRLGDVAYLILKENGAPMPYSELEAEIRRRRDYNYSLSSVLATEPKLSRPSRGYWALREWGLVEYDPKIHNRIGEVLVSIIEQTGRPVHKAEIRRQLRRRGMNLNEGTLQLDLTDNEKIQQVARGVYALAEWNLSFRDLFRYKFPFHLSIPDGNPTIYKMKDGVMIEYFVSKHCLELGRILVRRYMREYFPELKQYSKYIVTDFHGAKFEGWVDRVGEGRFQFMGLMRWYKSQKPRYGENIYMYIPDNEPNVFSILTAEQADSWIQSLD